MLRNARLAYNNRCMSAIYALLSAITPLKLAAELLVTFHSAAINKNTRQLEFQRLPGMNAAKIGIISESCKYFALFFCFCVLLRGFLFRF